MDYAKGRLLQQLREAARYLFGFFKIPNAPAAAENQADQHAEEADHEEQQRGARALSSPNRVAHRLPAGCTAMNGSKTLSTRKPPAR